MFGKLVPIGGGDPIPLVKPHLLVGRRPSCDITLDFPNVSSHHCEMEFVNGYWLIRDMNSRNGVKVNGERTQEKFLLPGDRVEIARHPYEITYVPQADAPPTEIVEDNPFAKSLLEKAGLERPARRPNKPAERQTPPSRPVADQKDVPASRPQDGAAKSPKNTEDRVLDWLSE